MRPARAALLAAQLLEAGVHVAAIQEARTVEGQLATGKFWRFCSGADRGHFGVELWFRMEHCLFQPGDHAGQPIKFSLRDFVVLFRDPRRIAVLFKSGDCHLLFVALHAPHRGTEPTVLAHWWNETTQKVFQAARGKELVVGADCNASIGSLESASVSDCGAEDQDDAGTLLHHFLTTLGLWAPATWGSVQSGPTWTFAQRRNGALTRPDFVLLPLAWQAASVHTWTEPGITAANMVLDHLATLADVQVRTSRQAPKKSGRRAEIDIKGPG